MTRLRRSPALTFVLRAAFGFVLSSRFLPPAPVLAAQEIRPATRIVSDGNFERPTLEATVSRSSSLAFADSMETWNVVRGIFSNRETVLIAAGREARILELDPREQSIRTIGGAGAGPGEFRAVAEFGVAIDDTLLVHDPLLQRISVFAPNRRFVRSLESGQLVRCCSPHGEYLLLEPRSEAVRGSVDDGIAAAQVHSALRHGAARATPSVPLFVAPTSGRRLITEATSGANGTFSFGPVYRLPLHPFPQVTWIRSGVAYASGSTAETLLYDLGTGARHVLRFSLPVRPLDQRTIRASRDSMLESVSDQRRRRSLARALEDVSWPATMPIFDLMKADLDGNLWLRSAQRTAQGAERWIGAQPTGALIGVVHLPLGHDALAFGRRTVLTKVTDHASGFDRLRILHLRARP